MTLQRCVWIGFFVAGCPMVSQAYPPAVAMVMDIQGLGTFQGPSGEKPLELLSELRAGGSVTLREGSHLVLVTVGKGESLHIPGPATFQLDPQGHPTKPITGLKAESPRSLQLKEGLKPAGFAQAGLVAKLEGESVDRGMLAEVLGSARVGSAIGSGVRSSLVLTAPEGTMLRDHSPEFRWKALGDPCTYRFRLTTQAGQELFRADLPQPEAKLPEGLELKPGASYRWEVTALLTGGKEVKASGGFTLLDQAQEHLLDEARPEPGAPFHGRVLYAYLLQESGLRVEARNAWRQLLAERPEDPVLKAHAH